MRSFRSFSIASGLAVVGSLLSVVAISPAHAVHVTCGQTITQSTTLDSDVGPCNAGITIGADNIIFDLGTFTISGTAAIGEGPGILLSGHSGVTIRNGTVTAFDAGVSIESPATGNTVTRMILRDNIANNAADYGDGIALIGGGTTGNTVTGNVVRHNGPFDGIGLVAGASDNTISGNQVVDSTVNFQTRGIGIEGPGSKNNTITRNTIRNTTLDGIEAFGFTNTNSGSTITNNIVSGSGRHGIVLFRNVAAAGAGSSIVQNNILTNNGGVGLLVQSLNNQLLNNRASGNVTRDLQDTNAECATNTWHGNQGATFTPPCTVNP